MEELRILQTIIYPLETKVIWSDGTKTCAKVTGNDSFDEEKGILFAIAKKFMKTSDILEAIEDGKQSVKRMKESVQ